MKTTEPVKHVPFNEPPALGDEIQYIQDAIGRKKLSGDGYYTKKCHELLEKSTGTQKAFLTTSCSSALEMAGLLANLTSEDNVLVPSFSFVTSASSFAMRGAKLVFCDVREDTLNINEELLEEAITPHTKAIITVHYAGVACEMDAILKIAKKHNLLVIEDAAQAIGSTYKDKACGAIGDMGCYSFHETKNISCGEGGALLVNHKDFIAPAEIAREKGTNRTRFFRGEVDKYTWVDLGSSYLPSELLAAHLYPQLLRQDDINGRRKHFWDGYHGFFEQYEQKGLIRRPIVPQDCSHNAHMYYVLMPDLESRTRFIDYLKAKQISAVFHYVPLHSSPGGQKHGHCAQNALKVTDELSERLVRMPLFYNLPETSFTRVLEECQNFLEKEM